MRAYDRKTSSGSVLPLSFQVLILTSSRMRYSKRLEKKKA